MSAMAHATAIANSAVQWGRAVRICNLAADHRFGEFMWLAGVVTTHFDHAASCASPTTES